MKRAKRLTKRERKQQSSRPPGTRQLLPCDLAFMGISLRTGALEDDPDFVFNFDTPTSRAYAGATESDPWPEVREKILTRIDVDLEQIFPHHLDSPALRKLLGRDPGDPWDSVRSGALFYMHERKVGLEELLARVAALKVVAQES